jgi:hypothetical protein
MSQADSTSNNADSFEFHRYRICRIVVHVCWVWYRRHVAPRLSDRGDDHWLIKAVTGSTLLIVARRIFQRCHSTSEFLHLTENVVQNAIERYSESQSSEHSEKYCGIETIYFECLLIRIETSLNQQNRKETLWTAYRFDLGSKSPRIGQGLAPIEIVDSGRWKSKEIHST